MIIIESTIDISGIIDSLDDRERVKWIRELIETTNEAGTIDTIRSLAARPEYDD